MFRIHRPRYADVAATLALVVALGGTSAYAAQQLHVPKHSVGKGELRRDAVTSSRIKNGKVKTQDLAPAAVGPGQLQDGAVGATKLAATSVGTAKLQDGAVTGAKVAKNSISLSDLVGASNTSTVSYTLATAACATLSVNVPGAQPGQVAALSLTGGADPGDVVFGPLRVTPNTVTFHACNLGATTTSAVLPVRVATFG